MDVYMPEPHLSYQFSWTKRDLCFGLLQVALLLCAVLQFVISSDPDNLTCVALVVVSSSWVIQYLWRTSVTTDHPLSALALLGLCVTTQMAALIAQTIDFVALVYLLRWPLTTFGVLACVQLLAVGTHWAYKNLAFTHRTTDLVRKKVLTPLHLMDAPPIEMIWIMAALGAAAAATGGGVATGDVGGKAFQAFNFMAYMPFLIPIYYQQMGESYCRFKIHGPLLLAYVGLLLGVAIVLNARQVMAIGPVQASLILLVYFWQDPKPITLRTLKRLTVFIVVTSMAVIVLADLAVAMVLVREKRDVLKPVELVQETFDAFVDRSRLAQFRADGLKDASYKIYNETYLSNPLIARFSETKFHDNTIHFATLLSDSERRELWSGTIDKIIGIVPQNILETLGIDLDKNQLAFSFGDFYRYLYEGPDNTFGGFVVGSFWAHIIGLFGLEWAPWVVMLLLFPSFIFIDSFAGKGRFLVSPAIICSSWSVFSYALGGESLVWKIGYYLRDLPQKALLYVVMYFSIKYVALLFGINLVKQQQTAEELNHGNRYSA